MRTVLTAIGISVLGFLAYGLAVDSPFVWYYVPITIVITAVVAWIHSTVAFSSVTAWALAAAAIGNMAGGILLVDGSPLYQLPIVGTVRYDKVFHALATGAAGSASYEALRAWGARASGWPVFGAVLMASGAGALVEIIEFIGSSVFESTSVGDYGNNMLDLVANLAGAVVGAGLAHHAERRRGHP